MFKSIGVHVTNSCGKTIITVYPQFDRERLMQAEKEAEKTAEFLASCLNQRERDNE